MSYLCRTGFCIEFWKEKHTAALEPSAVSDAVSRKLLYEHSQLQKQHSKEEPFEDQSTVVEEVNMV